MAAFLLRRAETFDVMAILAIERGSAPAAHWSESEYQRAIESSEHLVLVASVSDEVLGFLVASCAASEWELENIAVSGQARRRGIGRALLKDLISRARMAGAVEIRQEIRASNLAAQLLGQSLGFRQAGRRKSYYLNPQEDALLFNYLLENPE